jgi:hypothetical protein
MAGQYEFTSDQNALIGSLGSKMRFVGLFAVVLGVINLILAILAVTAIFRDRLPAGWKDKAAKVMKEAEDKLSPELKKQAQDYSLDKLPIQNHLWGIAINLAIVGLFYLLLGVWTRSAGDSFIQIVKTQGSDISHLMNGLGSLHSMYGLLYALLIATLIVGLISIGLTVWQSFAG